MALSDNDLKQIKKILKRDPSSVEYYIFDAMWSEHCSYKSSKPILKRLPTKAESVALGIGEDSGIIRFHEQDGDSYCIAISHESHNHPSQILPIEGAATGVGGCVRDVYCMGADVIGVLNSLHFGVKNGSDNFFVEEIEEKVIQGIADYGNPLGVPVLGGETLYHPSYNDNCLVNVAALGLIKEKNIIHSYVPKQAESEPYEIILFGKPTDSTGFGGASFSSDTLDEDNKETNVGAVQVHDPFLKRVFVEAIKACLMYLEENKIEIGFKDLGAGGIACATSELAVAGGFGVALELDKVLISDPGLKPEVIACSETQERFAMAVPATHTQAILDIFNKQFQIPDLHPQAGASCIGIVTKEKTYTINYQSNIVCDLDVAIITTEVHADRHSEPRDIEKEATKQAQLSKDITLKAICNAYLNSKLNVSKRYVYRFFDNAVKGNTVIYPGEADAVLIKPIPSSNAGLAVSMDSNLYGNTDPYSAGAYAVSESIRNIISVGATPLALTDCLNYGNPEKPAVFFDFEQGVAGIRDAAIQLSFHESDPIPIISGNVSFYNESKQGNAVVPSPVICAVGKINDIAAAKTSQLFKPNVDIMMIGKRYEEFAETQLQPYLSDYSNVAPQVRFLDEKQQNDLILTLYQHNLVESCHDISMGGLWVTLIEMILGERGNPFVGLEIDLSTSIHILADLFSENGGYVIATTNLAACKEHAKAYNVVCKYIGKTMTQKELSIKTPSEQLKWNINEISQPWNQFNP
ncbi:phosphoribosylformylglycinamidine synthase subunit PurL [Candidatus Marinamargulisbacteria bacterium SCGC AG-333-B06]|nr:phosphoribosylformylglycinamidine synthase subunit PurL [Candidatus Marinamargulisbacteria bacterium SCGC AG-333-B06]